MTDKDGKTARTSGKRRMAAWKSILGGDILAAGWLRRQAKLAALMLVLVIFYIHNRYACQLQMLEVDRLKKELTDTRYDALTKSAELMERSRQSRIEDWLEQRDTDLKTATEPPFRMEE